MLYAEPLRRRATFLKMREVLDSFGASPGVKTIADLTTSQVASWLGSLSTRNPNTLRSKARCLRTASIFAKDEGWLERVPQWRRLMPRRGPTLSVRHYNHGQVVQILDHLRSQRETWTDRRLCAIVCTVAYTGLRRGEVLRLQLGDLDLANRFLWVVARSRGLKTEASSAAVPIPAELVTVLADWIPEAGPTWLFPGVRRKGPWIHGAPGYRPMDRLEQASLRAGVPGVNFRGLRHSLAKIAVGKFGLSADQVRSLLRHNDTRTTEDHYLHRDDRELLSLIGARISFRREAVQAAS